MKNTTTSTWPQNVAVFFSLLFSEAAHVYSSQIKNFAIPTKFSNSMVEILSYDVQNFTAIQLIIIPQKQKHLFLHINEGTVPMPF